MWSVTVTPEMEHVVSHRLGDALRVLNPSLLLNPEVRTSRACTWCLSAGSEGDLALRRRQRVSELRNLRTRRRRLAAEVLVRDEGQLGDGRGLQLAAHLDSQRSAGLREGGGHVAHRDGRLEAAVQSTRGRA